MLDSLLRDHLASPFPPEARDLRLPDADLEMLEADIAGLADGYRNRGHLTVEQMMVLKGCHLEAQRVLGMLPPGGLHEYFSRLTQLAAAVIAEAPVRGSSMIDPPSKESRMIRTGGYVLFAALLLLLFHLIQQACHG